MIRPKPITILANGPIEITLGSGQLWISGLGGPLVHVLAARHVVFHYLDHDETQIYGDLTRPSSN